MNDAAELIQLPALPTRQDIADFCNRNRSWPRPITERSVRTWEQNGLIRPHPASRNPVRYDARHVIRFLEGR